MIKRYLSKWKNKISLELKRNRRAYIFVSMLFLTGLITGGIYADKIPLDNSSNAYKDFQLFTELNFSEYSFVPVLPDYPTI